MKHRCRVCWHDFEARRRDARYCSAACRQQAQRIRNDTTDLDREIEATRHRYWQLVRQRSLLELGAPSQIVTKPGTGRCPPYSTDIRLRRKWTGWRKPKPNPFVPAVLPMPSELLVQHLWVTEAMLGNAGFDPTAIGKVRRQLQHRRDRELNRRTGCDTTTRRRPAPSTNDAHLQPSIR